jgi:hypothetical protein
MSFPDLDSKIDFLGPLVAIRRKMRGGQRRGQRGALLHRDCSSSRYQNIGSSVERGRRQLALLVPAVAAGRRRRNIFRLCLRVHPRARYSAYRGMRKKAVRYA